MAKQPDDVLEAYEAAENSGLEPDTVDVPLPDIADDLQSGNAPANIDQMDELDLMESVMKRGSVMFSEGRMLTKCPGHSDAAVCGMYPLPHPETGDPIMVCTGPVIKKGTKLRLFGPNEEYYSVAKPAYSCPFHPDRINESPSDIGLSDSTHGGGWLD